MATQASSRKLRKAQPAQRAPSTRSSSAPGSLASINCSACVTDWVFRSRCSRRAQASAAPGTGTATPVRAATRKATPTATRSPKELTREWEWSERYPGPPEILRYLNHVADRFDLKRDIRFNTRVTRRALRRDRQSLAREHRGGRDVHGAVPDHRGRLPVDGQRSQHPRPRQLSRGAGFTPASGRTKASISRGKRVGMIGTGSTGIQAAPVIAETAAHLTVFQRTANYSVPARNAPLTPEFKRYVKENDARDPRR